MMPTQIWPLCRTVSDTAAADMTLARYAVQGSSWGRCNWAPNPTGLSIVCILRLVEPVQLSAIKQAYRVAAARFCRPIAATYPDGAVGPL